jgi:hypothetical protein
VLHEEDQLVGGVVGDGLPLLLEFRVERFARFESFRYECDDNAPAVGRVGRRPARSAGVDRLQLINTNCRSSHFVTVTKSRVGRPGWRVEKGGPSNAPTRIIAAPANLPPTSPNGIVFSSRTKMAIAAIHMRFITPLTNSNPIIRIQLPPS